jgi:MFS family permease
VPTAAINRGRFRTLVFTWLGLTTQAVPLAGLPLLLPLIRTDLGLSYIQAGSLASANLLVYALMQIPAGYLADRYSPRKLVGMGVMGLMGLSILLAFSRFYWQILAIEFFWGFFSSLMFTPSMSVFIRWFSEQRHTTASTLPVVGTNLGILAVNLLFPLIANRFDTWRAPFVIFGLAGISFSFGLLFFGKDARAMGTRAKISLDLIREVFRYKQVWLCYALQFIRFGVVQGLMFWLPTLLINEKQFSLHLTGAIIAMQAIVSGSTNIFVAYLAERYRKPILVIGLSMIILSVTSAFMVPVGSAGLIIAIIFLNAIFLQAYFGPLFTLAVEILGPEKTGVSNGVSNMFAIFGGLVSAYLMGVLRDTTGSFEWGFYSISILCAVGLILTLVLAKVRRAEPAPKS